MSITRIREMMNNKGCQIPMIIVGGLLMLGFVMMGFSPTLFQQNLANPQDKPLATVGKVAITGPVFESIVTKSTQNYPPEFISQPETSTMVYQGVIAQVTSMAALQDLANERGIKLDDKQVLAETEKLVDEQIKQAVMQLQAMGKLKPDAKDADIDAAFKENFQGDRKALKERVMDQQKADLTNPNMRLIAVAPVLNNLLVEAEKKNVTYSEDDLKKSFDQFTFDVVKFNRPEAKPEEVKANAEKGLADLRAGKTTDQVRDAYGKKLGKDEKPTQTISRSALEVDPESKTLLAMKAGDLTPVMNQFGETKVMKLVSIENKLPADFDKQKAALLDTKKKGQAEKKLAEEIKKRAQAAVWSSPGLGALAQWAAITTDDKVANDPDKRTAAIAAVQAKIAGLKDDMPLGKKALALAQFATSSDLYQAAKTPEDKKKWGKAKLDAYHACFEYGESAESRLTAATLAQELGEKDAVFENLVEAARNNTQYTQQGEQLNARVTEALTKAQAATMLTADQAKVIQKEIDTWKTNKYDFEKEQAEIAKEKAAAENAGKAEQEKLKEEEKKAVDSEKAAAPAPAAKDESKSPAPVIPGVGGGK